MLFYHLYHFKIFIIFYAEMSALFTSCFFFHLIVYTNFWKIVLEKFGVTENVCQKFRATNMRQITWEKKLTEFVSRTYPLKLGRDVKNPEK